MVGRLRDGVSLAAARSELDAIAAALAREMPLTNAGWGVRIESLPATLERGLGRALRILEGAVLLVLLIACGNVAGLLLSDGAARTSEMAVRSALGATRGRLMRQWFTESAVIAGAGAVLGLAFAWAGLRGLVAWLPPGLPGLDALSLDASALAFTVAATAATALLVGIAPALQASRAGVAEALNRAGRLATATGSSHRLRSAFVVAQVAVAVVLTIGAGLLLHSLVRLRAVDPGVDTRNLVTFQVHLDGREYIRDTDRYTPSGAIAAELTPRLLNTAARIRERIEALPGVEAATAMAATPPLSGFARRYGLVNPVLPAAADGQPAPIEWFAVLPGYFETLGVRPRSGRDIDVTDAAAGLPVAIVSESLAAELWPGRDAIGREIQLNLFNEPARQVVGVVPDVRQAARVDARPRQVYVPFAQIRTIQSSVVAHGLERLTFVVRSGDGEAQLAAPFRRAVAEVDASRAVTAIQPLSEYVSAQVEGFVQYVLLLGVFGAAAVVLALVGTHGLMAHTVRLRTAEIGIRMALGASHGQALRFILRRGLGLSAIGVVIGIGGALALTRVLESFLWEVTAADPLTFVAVSLALGTAAAAACYTAARRALSIDPAAALRHAGQGP